MSGGGVTMDSGSLTPFGGPPDMPTDSLPPTPSEGILFTPRRAMASFDNLVALANHQERLREARKMVWRDRGQPVVELETLKDCLEHAATGGFRSGTLAFSIRACVNLVLVLIRIRKFPRDIRPSVIRHAVFGTDTWRFAAMLGSFTSLYKFILNALPILIPAVNPSKRPFLTDVDSSPFEDEAGQVSEDGPTASNPSSTVKIPLAQRTARLSLSAKAQLVLIRKRTRKWHAALAGAVAGGLAVMWEKKGRRGVIAQQLFVRGLQGSYNSFTTKRGIHIPHGAVLVFSLACGQIMYAFLLRPDTLPRSYTQWIGQAAKVPGECVKINMGLVRDRKIDIAHLDRIVARRDITPSNITELTSLRPLYLAANSLGASSPSAYVPFYAPCSAVHPALSSCSSVPLDRFFAVFKWMLPIYGALHFIPAALFKRKEFMRDPGKVFVRAGLGTMRSSAFLGVFVIIYQTIFCYKHKLHKYLSVLKMNQGSKSMLASVPQWIIDLLISKGSFWFLGLMAGLGLFVEEKRRRAELAMYVLPKALESAWVAARGKGWVFRTGNWGEMLLTAIGMAMVMSTYQNDPQHLSGIVRRILYQFIGPN